MKCRPVRSANGSYLGDGIAAARPHSSLNRTLPAPTLRDGIAKHCRHRLSVMVLRRQGFTLFVDRGAAATLVIEYYLRANNMLADLKFEALRLGATDLSLFAIIGRIFNRTDPYGSYSSTKTLYGPWRVPAFPGCTTLKEIVLARRLTTVIESRASILPFLRY